MACGKVRSREARCADRNRFNSAASRQRTDSSSRNSERTCSCHAHHEVARESSQCRARIRP